MADGNVILSSAKIVCADATRRYVVVSAPGKRFSGDIKVTDLLFALYNAYEKKDTLTFDEVFEKISVRFLNIEREIGRDLQVQKHLDKVKAEILGGAGLDYCVSRGEYIAAQIMAEVLSVPFVDATEFVRFDERGLLKEETYELAESVLERYPRAVIPGFYGLSVDGKVKTFSRGGGDISGAVVAQIISSAALGFFAGGNILLIILGVVLLVVGHAFNLVMNLLGAYIHDARLQYVEFYGRFFEGEGELFKPLGSSHKYIRLKTE